MSCRSFLAALLVTLAVAPAAATAQVADAAQAADAGAAASSLAAADATDPLLRILSRPNKERPAAELRPSARLPPDPELPRGLWYVLAALALLVFFSFPALAAACVARAFPSPHGAGAARRRARLANAVLYALFFAGALWLSHHKTFPERFLDSEQEMFLSVAATCADGGVCPLAGPPMGDLMVRIGPLFYELLTFAYHASPSPELLYWLILILHAGAAVLLAFAGDRWLGRPWGLLAGLLFATSFRLSLVHSMPTHAAFAPIALVGFFVALLAWLRGGGGLAFLAAAGCLGAATQLHAVTALFFPAWLLVWALYRPKTPDWSWLGAVALLGLLYAPWLTHYALTDFADFRIMELPRTVGRELTFEDLGQATGVAMRIPVALCLLVALVRAFAAPSRHDRRALQALLLFYAFAAAFFLAAASRWTQRYNVLFFPLSPLVVVVGLHGLWSFLVSERNGALWRRVVSIMFGVLVCESLLRNAIQLRVSQAEHVNRIYAIDYAEQRDVLRALSGRGFGAADFERRVHGFGWIRYGLASGYLGVQAARDTPSALPGEGSAATGDGSAAREQALVVPFCRRIPASFSTWQARKGGAAHSLVIATYVPRIGPVAAVLHGGRAAPFAAPLELPLIEFDGHYGPHRARLAAFAPAFALSPARQGFFDAWQGAPTPSTLVMETTVARGPDARALVLAHDRSLPAEVFIDGLRRTPDSSSKSAHAPIVYERFLLPPKSPHTVKITLTKTKQGFPYSVDLYEEPAQSCEEPVPPAPEPRGAPGPWS